MSKRVPDLPIIGEPLIAEFANTLYVDGTTRLDVLERPSWIAAWLRQAPCAADLIHPDRLRSHDAAQLRVLRDAVRGLLECRRDCRAVDIEVINAAARRAMSQRRLVLNASGEPEVVTVARSSDIEGVLSAIALSVIDAVANGTFDLHQVCNRPSCNLYYFRDHYRRSYCNSRCANADRQARYNARRAEPSRSQTAARSATKRRGTE